METQVLFTIITSILTFIISILYLKENRRLKNAKAEALEVSTLKQTIETLQKVQDDERKRAKEDKDSMQKEIASLTNKVSRLEEKLNESNAEKEILNKEKHNAEIRQNDMLNKIKSIRTKCRVKHCPIEMQLGHLV